MNDESAWISRAQSAEAKLNTMKQSLDKAVERVRSFKANFGVREKDNGEIVIDFKKMVERLGKDGAMDLRSVIEEVYGG